MNRMWQIDCGNVVTYTVVGSILNVIAQIGRKIH